jgi:FtsP/CotA-like multicopper oxidase with cupredoxin domain
LISRRFVDIVFFTVFAGAILFSLPAKVAAQQTNHCQRPNPGSIVPEPADLRSQDGILKVDLTIYNIAQADGTVRYCYEDASGDESPNLRVKQGDLVILNFKNELTKITPAAGSSAHVHSTDMQISDACANATMSSVSSNLHFHGLTIPPTCHQDDVLKTLVDLGDKPFEYRFRIPENEPPGLYWYHPHVHGFSKVQVLGGASGALIVEGIERATPSLAGMPERVIVIRDQDLMNPNAPPSKLEPVVPHFLIDRDGDAANNGTGFGLPAKDLSINFVPVPYPNYPPAKIRMRAGEQQLWRILNASAITYLNLQLLVNRVPQKLGLVGMDGVPLNSSGRLASPVEWETHLGIPPGARVEVIVNAPPAGSVGLFVTRTVDTGPGGENDTNRALAIVRSSEDAPEPQSKLADASQPLARPSLPWLGDVRPVQIRKLYFSEKLTDPNNPTSATEFYLTVDGQTPQMFDMNSNVPNIVAKQGTVEDWIIENRSNELHAFHIHQLHFVLLDYDGVTVNEPFLRDTVNVPYYNGRALGYPSVRVRMDFRDPNTVGTFVYHCHLLEHEDGGMMGLIQVDPADLRTSGHTNPSSLHDIPSLAR